MLAIASFLLNVSCLPAGRRAEHLYHPIRYIFVYPEC